MDTAAAAAARWFQIGLLLSLEARKLYTHSTKEQNLILLVSFWGLNLICRKKKINSNLECETFLVFSLLPLSLSMFPTGTGIFPLPFFSIFQSRRRRRRRLQMNGCFPKPLLLAAALLFLPSFSSRNAN